MIVFKKDIDLQLIEETYVELYAQAKNYHIDLQIPSRCKFTGFASFSSFIQFVITWKRLSNTGKLIIVSGTPGKLEVSDDDIESIVKRYYGFIASIISWDDGVITTNGHSIKDSFRLENSRLMNALSKKDFITASRGDSINFPFFDHIESSRGLLSIVYKNQKLCTELDFKNLTNALINAAFKNNSVLLQNFESTKSHVNGILFELFENTHKWARKSHKEKAFNPSYRGIYSNLYKIELDNIDKYADSVGLKEYFQQLVKGSIGAESVRYIACLELSINDSGSGLAQRYAEQDVTEMSIESECKFLRECLMKHNTSHKEFGDAQGRGIGLHRMMELLDITRGFLRIRSGRMHLYRNFLKNAFYDKFQKPNYFLLDWDSNTTNPTMRAKVEGTSINLIIPYLIG